MHKFTIIEAIGEGGYGVVYKAKRKNTGQLVAIKKITSKSIDHGLPRTAIREHSILRDLKHPNIISLEDVFLDKNPLHMYLVYELLFMDLRQYMKSLGSRKCMEPERVQSFMLQITNAIHHCHTNRIIHMDLKPSNLLIDKTGVIKLGDFGVARIITVPVRVCSPSVMPLNYSAPEILLGSSLYSCPIDIWSLGCVFFEMSSNKKLFKGHSEKDQLVKIFRILGTPTEDTWPGVSRLPNYSESFLGNNRNDLDDHVKNLDESGMDLLKRMLICDPRHRISAKDARDHSYFSAVNVPVSLASHPLYAGLNITPHKFQSPKMDM